MKLATVAKKHTPQQYIRVTIKDGIDSGDGRSEVREVKPQEKDHSNLNKTTESHSEREYSYPQPSN